MNRDAFEITPQNLGGGDQIKSFRVDNQRGQNVLMTTLSAEPKAENRPVNIYAISVQAIGLTEVPSVSIQFNSQDKGGLVVNALALITVDNCQKLVSILTEAIAALTLPGAGGKTI